MRRLPYVLPAYAINGLSVALGVAVVHALATALAGEQVAALVVAGAVCTSLADLPATRGRNLQRVWRAAVLAVVAALAVDLLRPWPWLLGVGVAAIAGTAALAMAWGPRAGPVSFAPILAMVFTLAVRPEVPALTVAAWHAAGALAFIAWSVTANALLQRRYRSLALAAALAATARLLQSRAGVLEADDPGAEGRLRDWVGDEARLAEALQVARDLLFDARDSERAVREIAVLLRTIDLRDVLLASRLDLDLLGDDELARWVRHRVAGCLREVATVLDGAEAAVRGAAALPPDAPPTSGADALAGAPMDAGDPRARLLPLLVSRIDMLSTDARRVLALLRGEVQPLPLSREELKRFVGPETWPLAALRSQLRFESPVLRHALRSGLALGCAYFIGLALPWASHPHWLVLSVAVVLRGNLEQTLARRNARVAGTMIGCALVLVLARLAALQEMAFLVAVGVAHSFVTVRYLVTAIAATVMALLQAHLVDPTGGFAIGERVADTVLGAVLAWAFSYVLPSWERRNLPRSVGRVLAALGRYAEHALRDAGGRIVAQRLARLQAYDALGSLAVAVQSSAAEPQRVQVPIGPLTQLLDHAHRLMAHLSAIRMTRLLNAAALQSAGAQAALADAEAALRARLQLDAAAASMDPRDALGVQALPSLPPADDPTPWLLRRLQLAVHDAHRVGDSARSALAAGRQ